MSTPADSQPVPDPNAPRPTPAQRLVAQLEARKTEIIGKLEQAQAKLAAEDRAKADKRGRTAFVDALLALDAPMRDKVFARVLAALPGDSPVAAEIERWVASLPLVNPTSSATDSPRDQAAVSASVGASDVPAEATGPKRTRAAAGTKKDDGQDELMTLNPPE